VSSPVGSGGHWNSSIGSNSCSHSAGGYGFGNPGNGYYDYVSVDAHWNNDPAPNPAYGAGDSFDPNSIPTAEPAFSTPGIGTPQSAAEFIETGMAAFKAGAYAEAVRAWRHAALDDPQNGALMIQLGQALFAAGQYREAAFVIQVGMHHLPIAQWGDVVGHYTRLYGDPHDYTNQLRALEEAIRLNTEDPALRFVAGFEFGYLGFLEQSIVQLDEAMLLVSHDEMTDLLHNEMLIRLKESAARRVAHGPAHHPAHSIVPMLH
jgi:tetratricopeptide (TPR) repeat protein